MQDFPETLHQSSLLSHWNGAIDALTSLLGLAALNGPTSSDNLQWRDCDLDDNGSTGFGCDSLDLLPSCSAI